MVVEWFAETYIPNNTSLIFGGAPGQPVVDGGNLFLSQLLDDPDNAIALFKESGVREPYMNEYASNSRGMLVQGRGSYSFLKDKMLEIENNIDNLTEQNATDFQMKSCRMDQGIQQIEIDSQGRRVWTSHYLILINNFDSQHRQPITQP